LRRPQLHRRAQPADGQLALGEKKEIDMALAVQAERGEGYCLLPLLLPGMKPAALGLWFDKEPVAVAVKTAPGKLAEALPEILAGPGLRVPEDKEIPQQVAPAAVDELILELREAIQLAKTLDDYRTVAAATFQLGTVRMLQERYGEALAAYEEARTIFEGLGEPGSVATIWHQTGVVYRQARQFEAAERAYRQSLAIKVQHNNRSGEATSLLELGNLYNAWQQPRDTYLAYRRDGGYAQTKTGDICDMLNQAIQQKDNKDATQIIAAAGQRGWNETFVSVSTAIIPGEHTRRMLDNPDLDYDDSAELLLLLERLEAASPSDGSG
jgi:tetratricopeptide (TPR) repeat protein